MRNFRPYVSKVVKRIPITERAEREHELIRAGYNMFDVDARKVTIDLLSDSGTGALSEDQKAAGERADERYAGAESFFRFQDAVHNVLGYPLVLPVHQGRAGERILFECLLSEGQISLSNTHFDTTRANLFRMGCEARQLPCPEAADLGSKEPFKGNIDLNALEATLAGPEGHRVGLVLMTITNNGGGGQPVSMANLTATSELCRRYGVPFFLDAARYAENAWLIVQREPGYAQHSVAEVARRAFDLADGCLISLKKDGFGNVGGLLALRDQKLHRKCAENLIITEGYRTYGGLAGDALEKVAVGMQEALDPDYLRSREDDAIYLAQLANKAGVETVQPPGMHAIYLDAARLLPHLRPGDFPGQALTFQLYLEGGIRSGGIDSLYLGEIDDHYELVTPAPFELVRLAIPRRVYDRSHLEYVGDVLAAIAQAPERIPGYRIVDPGEPRPNESRMAPRI
jgi:tryptophanase